MQQEQPMSLNMTKQDMMSLFLNNPDLNLDKNQIDGIMYVFNYILNLNEEENSSDKNEE
jgi:hypothetical protein